MVAKFAIFSCLVAAAAAVAVPVVPYAKVAYAEPDAPAQYEFEYSVRDDITGDVKQQKEARSGDSVQGSYSLIQPDGVHRIVDYTSDEVNGFNAIVRYEGQAIAEPAKIAYAAPIAKVAYAPAPTAYAPAPITKIAYAPAPAAYAPAPVTKIAYAPAPTTYTAAPVTKIAYAPAPTTYTAAPVTKIAYAPAPATYTAAPVTKIAYAQAPINTYSTAPIAKVAYTAPLGHVTFSSPAISYQH